MAESEISSAFDKWGGIIYTFPHYPPTPQKTMILKDLCLGIAQPLCCGWLVGLPDPFEGENNVKPWGVSCAKLWV